MEQNKSTMVRAMTEGGIFQQLIRFALPLMLANALQTVYALVDAMVVGKCLGAVELAAVSTTSELVTFYTMICMGFASAGQIIVGQYVGKRDGRSVSRTAGTLIAFLGALAVVCTAICFASADWQLRLINVPEESFPAGRVYFLTCAAGMIFVFGYNCVSAILRGMGDSKRPLLFVAIASLSNLALDLLFILGFGLGVFGAALATVMGQAISLVVSSVYLYRKREELGVPFDRQSLRPTAAQLKLVLRLGIPQAAQFAAVLVSIMFVGAQINSYGVAASAVNGAASKLENILRIVCNSMSTAGCTMVAQNVGAGRHDRVRKIIYDILAVCVAYTALCALMMWSFPRQIFSLFNKESEVLAYAAVYALPGVITYLGHGIRATFSTVYNGVGNAGLSLCAGLLDGVVARIGLAILLGKVMGMGLQGYWYGSALAGYVAAIIGGIYFFSGRWERYRLLD